MFNVLILIDDNFIKESLDLLAVAEELKEFEKLHVYAAGINIDINKVKGVDTFIDIIIPKNQYNKDSKYLTDIVQELNHKYDFDCILTLATDFGRMLAPRIASRLRVGIVADVTKVKIEKGRKLLVRPSYSGNMMASIVCESNPIMLTIRPGIFNYQLDEGEFDVIQIKKKKMKAQTVKLNQVYEFPILDDITKSEIIISVGSGYHGNIEELSEISEMLGASIGATKSVVETGEISRNYQIGQSGKIVSPRLYIALGISGAIHHVSGLKNVDVIVSVNTDKIAPMNYLADFCIIGDSEEFVTKLKCRLEREFK